MDKRYINPDVNRSMATHLKDLSRKLSNMADRFTNEDCPLNAKLLGVPEIEDICIEQQVVSYLKQNWGKIGDTSTAYGVVNIVRHGSQYYRK